MPPGKGLAFLLAIALLAICVQNSKAQKNELKSMVYLSPKIPQHPGSVSKKYYYDIEFPKGHIAIKSFNAEVVDEAGDPVSLQETYLHHWITLRYYHRKGVEFNDNLGPDFIIAGNAGLCDHGLSQFFGLGSETRKTSTNIPDPYGIEVGNPLEVPAGYEEKWLFNIHAIDTRGTVDAMGCTECRCDLYNVTKDEYGQPLKPDYVGGIHCCYDGTQCKLKNGIKSIERNLYLRYTVKWVDWSDFIVPVQIFILDVTDPWQYTGIHDCLIEYDIEKSTTGVATHDFTSTKRSIMILPIEGDVVYAVAHQHIGGIGSALYGEDGRIICSSAPIYGHGKTAGDEAGYIVGRSTCYPEPGTMRIAKGEALTVESNYSNEKRHTGVMGHFYILIANTSLNFNEPVQVRSLPFLRYTFSKKLIMFNGLIYLKTIVDMKTGMHTLLNK
ncbi:putative stress up-regulated Nod 19 [Helianthus debilis subsp. tardiflorus]